MLMSGIRKLLKKQNVKQEHAFTSRMYRTTTPTSNHNQRTDSGSKVGVRKFFKNEIEKVLLACVVRNKHHTNIPNETNVIVIGIHLYRSDSISALLIQS